MRKEQALSLDFDGVVFDRIPFQWSAIPRLVKRHPIDFSPPQEIPVLHRSTSTRRSTVTERFNRWRHSMPVKKDMDVLIPRLFRDWDIYGNSGRLNHFLWTEKTRLALKEAQILPYFTNIFYKPEDAKGLVSKLAAVGELRETYGRVTHVDDNPQDAIPIAIRFPDVLVVILEDRSTGLLVSMKELQKYPNVRRVAQIHEAFGLQAIKSR